MVSLGFSPTSDDLGRIEGYLARMQDSILALNKSAVADLANLIWEARERGSRVFVAGNGGSASTAEHIALDWMLGTGLSNPSLQVTSISQSPAALTATGNDLNFEMVFSRQLSALAARGDLVVVISASGNSPNLLSLVKVARELGVHVVAITGFDGGRLAEAADLSVIVPTRIGDYGVSEDLHLMIGHIVKEILISRKSN